MSEDDHRLAGRRDALALVQGLKKDPPPLPPAPSFDGIITALESLPDPSDALGALAEKLGELKRDDADYSAICEAIAGLDITATFDAASVAQQLEAISQRKPVDLTPVVDKLDGIRKAMEDNTRTLAELVAAAKMPKKVTYDSAGRITKISVEGAG